LAWAFGKTSRYLSAALFGTTKYQLQTDLGLIVIDSANGFESDHIDGTITLKGCRLELPAAVLLQLSPDQKHSGVDKRLNIGATERIDLVLSGKAEVQGYVIALKGTLELSFPTDAL